MIYTVTVLRSLDMGQPDSTDNLRTWGYFNSFEDAEKAVLENQGDIFEQAYYLYAVIEEVPEGLMPIPEKEFFYHNSKEGIKKIEKPEELKQYIGWSMG